MTHSSARGVVIVASRPDGDRRSFALDPASEGAPIAFLEEIAHENELIGRMAGLGYRLTFVGGGSRSDELRRFYFRRL